MIVILVLILLSLLLAFTFLGAYLWAVSTGQFEDMYTPSVRILADDIETNPSNNISNNSGVIDAQK